MFFGISRKIAQPLTRFQIFAALGNTKKGPQRVPREKYSPRDMSVQPTLVEKMTTDDKNVTFANWYSSGKKINLCIDVESACGVQL